jgi:GNAT superfamily N-acetyltransferase
MLVRYITPADVTACNDFHNRFYGKRRTEAQWRWEFGHYSGDRNPFFVVEDEGRIVGTQALIPLTMVDAEGEFPCGKSEETLIDASLRGKNVLEQLFGLAYAYAAETGMQTIWGFTPAIKPLKRVGFAIMNRTSQLFLPLSSRALSALQDQVEIKGLKQRLMPLAVGAASLLSSARFALAGGDPQTGLRLEILTEPPAGAGDLCHRFVKEWGGVTLLRDAAYLQWRFYDNPFVRSLLVGAYRGDTLVGWLAYALDDQGMGVIVDCLVVSGGDRALATEVLTALVRHAVVELRAAGALAVRTWRVNDHPFDALLTAVAKRLGFFHVNRGESVIIHPTGGDARPASLKRFDNWYITRAYTQGIIG